MTHTEGQFLNLEEMMWPPWPSYYHDNFASDNYARACSVER